MRKAILAVLVTAVGLVLLLSFKPHELAGVAATPPAAVSQAPGPQPSTGEPLTPARREDQGDEAGEEEGEDEDDQGAARPQQNLTAPLPRQHSTAPRSNGTWTGPGATAGATSGDKVVTGDVADTRWGPVQVELVLSGGRMAGVRVLQAPDGNQRDLAISSAALPRLNDEALAAQSAGIDAVSGATYTSAGYVRSLQSALDRAGL